MKRSNSYLFLTLICSFGCVILATDSVSVPAMLWKGLDNGKVSTRSIPALIEQNLKNFQQLNAEESDNFKRQIIVFLRDSLCVEDFKLRQNGVTCHQNLAQLKNTKYVPAVHDPFFALQQLNKTTLNVDVETTNDLSKPIGDQRIIYVNMPDRYHDDTVEEYNIRLDEIVFAVAQKMNYLNPLYVITGRQCKPQTTSHSRQRRDVPVAAAQKASTPQILKNPNLLVYFETLTVYKKSGNNAVDGVTLSVSEVGESSLKAQLNAEQSIIAFNVHDFGSTWHVQEITVNDIRSVPSKHISAPVGFSYKCSPNINISISEINSEIVAVGIRGLQIQPKFGNAADSPLNRFGDVNDCTGFTSIGIWSGLVVSFLLLGILTLGLSWILDIRTMDRFDDPKGTCEYTFLSDLQCTRINFHISVFFSFFRL